MAQATYTPIQLYHSTTAAAVPTSGNLANGELALNISDMKLYAKNSGGTVTLLASNAASAPVLSFQTSLGGLTPSTATTGVVTLAGTLNTTSGGTGLTSFTAGDVPYYASGSVLSKLAIGTAGQFLTSSGTAPQWSTLSGVAVTTFSAGTTGFTPSSATSGVVTLAGTLATTNGGTGLTSFTSGGVVYASSTSALATGSALTFNGTTLELSGSTASAVQQIFGRGPGATPFSVRYTNGTSGTSTFIGALGLDYADGVWADMATIKFYRNSTAGELAFFTSTAAASGTEQMRLTSTGLGIGTSSPSQKLHVASTSNAQGLFATSGAGGGSNRSSVILQGPSNTWYINTNGSDLNGSDGALGFYGNSTTRMVIDTSGNVGIGTSSPAAKLDVVGGNIRVDNNQGLLFGGANNYIYGNETTDFIALVTNGTEAARINSAGGLQTLNTIGVGNATPSTSGAGITFPATQSASSNANTLDDYEEGTWTPTDNSGASLTFTVNANQYTKVGRAVTVNFEITWPSTADGSVVSVSLPFSANANNRCGLSCMSNVAGEVNIYTPGTANFNLYNDTGTQITNATMSTKYLIVSLTYFT